MISKDLNVLDGKYLFRIAGIIANKIKVNATGIGVVGVTRKFVTDIEIPLQPIEIQHEIVAELEAEQQLINANKKLIEIYQQKIKSKIAEVWGE